MTHEIIFFASFPVVKQEHVERNTECIGLPHLFIGFLSVMVVIANFCELHDDSDLLME